MTVWRGVLLAALTAFALALPWWIGPAHLGPAVDFATLLALASLWNLLAGYGGIVSIGQQGFVGLGGYALFALVGLGGVSPLLALPLAGVASGCVALPLALLLFRLRGPHFAIGTWVVADALRLLLAQVTVLGGGSGQSLPVAAVRAIAPDRAARQLVFYLAALVLVAATTLLTAGLLRSRLGLGLLAMRDSETAAAGLGVDVRRLRLGVYVAVATLTGAVGALIFLQALRISPDAAFSVTDWTADIIFIAVIGGIGTLEGPLLGTAVFFALRGLFAQYGALYEIALGVLAAAVMLVAPGGIGGALAGRAIALLPPAHRPGVRSP